MQFKIWLEFNDGVNWIRQYFKDNQNPHNLLVWSDWLEEHGDVEHANLIRTIVNKTPIAYKDFNQLNKQLKQFFSQMKFHDETFKTVEYNRGNGVWANLPLSGGDPIYVYRTTSKTFYKYTHPEDTDYAITHIDNVSFHGKLIIDVSFTETIEIDNPYNPYSSTPTSLEPNVIRSESVIAQPIDVEEVPSNILATILQTTLEVSLFNQPKT